MLKVSPKNNGSQHLVLGTEEILPGSSIPTHKHLGRDEILLIQRGTAHIWLGDQERDLHAGGLVFIPTNPNGDVSAGTFGQVISARDPRFIQFGTKLTF